MFPMFADPALSQLGDAAELGSGDGCTAQAPSHNHLQAQRVYSPVTGEGAHLFKCIRFRKAGIQGSECINPDDTPLNLWVTATFLGLGLQVDLEHCDFCD